MSTLFKALLDGAPVLIPLTAATIGAVASVSGTPNEIASTGGTNPVISLPSALTFTGKTVTGGTFNSGAFNGTLGATTPSTVAATTVTASGQGLFSTGAARVVGVGTPILQIEGTNTNTGHFSVTRNAAAAAGGPFITLGRSGAGTVGSVTAVANNFNLGNIDWAGADGTSLTTRAATIRAQVEGTVSNGIVPAGVGILTANSSGVLTEGLRVNSSQQSLLATGSASAPSLAGLADTNTGISWLGSDVLAVSTGGSERTRWSSGGVLLHGHTAVVQGTGLISQIAQIHSAGTGGLGVFGWSSGASSSRFEIARSKSGTIGTHSAVGSSEQLGVIIFAGSDGANFIQAANIQAFSDGAVSPGVVPGRLIAVTNDSAGVARTALDISSGQQLRGQNGTDALPTWTFINGNTSGMGRTAGGALFLTVGGGATRLYLDAAGRQINNDTTGRSLGGLNAGLQLNNSAGSASQNMSQARWANDGNPAAQTLFRSRSTTVGTFGSILSSGDVIGVRNFAGDDGVDGATVAARDFVDVIGTPAANRLAGRYTFQCASGAADDNLTTAMRLTSQGVEVANGSVSLPSVFFNSSSTSGFYYIGTNNLGAAAGAVKQYEWSANGFFTSRALHGAQIEIATATTLDASHETVFVNASAGGFDVTIPAASGRGGRKYNLIRIDSSANLVNVVRSSTDNVMFGTSVPLNGQGTVINIQSNGSSNWYPYA